MVSTGGCTVIHHEQYVLPSWLAPRKHVLRLYLRWSMARELRDLERLIAMTLEDPARRSRGARLQNDDTCAALT